LQPSVLMHFFKNTEFSIILYSNSSSEYTRGKGNKFHLMIQASHQIRISTITAHLTAPWAKKPIENYNLGFIVSKILMPLADSECITAVSSLSHYSLHIMFPSVSLFNFHITTWSILISCGNSRCRSSPFYILHRLFLHSITVKR